MKSEKEIATFGAGCFWHVQAEFDKLKGILKTDVGFMGGETKNPTYKQVCIDKTSHAEVCQVEFNPKIISYEKLIESFWQMHDPTQINKQGLDIGSQYRSVIFYRSPKQKELAEKSKEKMQKEYDKKIVTQISPAKEFYLAEKYHQKYFEKNNLSACSI